MAQEPPLDGPGRQPVYDPELLQKTDLSNLSEEDESAKSEEEKEAETKPEDFESFGDPSRLKQVKDETDDEKEE